MKLTDILVKPAVNVSRSKMSSGRGRRHSKVSQTRFSLIRSVPFCPSASIVHSEQPPAERRASFTRRDRDERWARRPRGFISPINFVDSGWRKNWVKSRGRISSIFSPIPIIPLRVRLTRCLFLLQSLHKPSFIRLQLSSRDTSHGSPTEVASNIFDKLETA